MSSQKSFKDTHPFPRRLEESKRVLAKYPDRIPVIMEKLSNNKKDGVPMLDRVKFLVPKDVSVTQFTFIIRKRIELAPEKAIFIFVEDNLPPSSALVSELYETYHDDDGEYLWLKFVYKKLILYNYNIYYIK